MTKIKDILALSFLTGLLTFAVLMMLSLTSSAQGKTTAVFLKNGDVHFGKLLQSDNHGNVRISNDCGIFNLNAGEIDSTILKYKMPYKTRQKGYYNLSSAALLFGEGQDGIKPIASLTVVNGWQFTRKFFTGIGLGYEFYDWGVIPVFAEAKYMLGSDRVIPFGSLRVGYSFPAEKASGTNSYFNITKYYGGISLNPEVGIRLPVGEASSLMISLGYHFQQLAQREAPGDWWWTTYDRKVHTDYSRISLKVGFMFQ